MCLWSIYGKTKRILMEVEYNGVSLVLYISTLTYRKNKPHRRITVLCNVKSRTSWAKTWQTAPPYPTYSCGRSISFKQGVTFTQFSPTVNRPPRRTAHFEMTSLCYIWFGAKHPDNMWWSQSAVGGERRGRRTVSTAESVCLSPSGV